jgi:hypothetical protein
VIIRKDGSNFQKNQNIESKMVLLENKPEFEEVCVVGTMHSTLDGAVRLQNDIQRFCFRVTALRLRTRDDISAEIVFTISLPADWDEVEVLWLSVKDNANLTKD